MLESYAPEDMYDGRSLTEHLGDEAQQRLRREAEDARVPVNDVAHYAGELQAAAVQLRAKLARVRDSGNIRLSEEDRKDLTHAATQLFIARHEIESLVGDLAAAIARVTAPQVVL